MMGSGHRFALALVLGIGVAWGGAMAWALARATPTGDTLIAVFPLPTSREVAFAATVDAGGVLVRETWLPNAWVVAVEDEGAAERLRGAGVWWLAPADPFRFAMIGGCGLVTTASR